MDGVLLSVEARLAEISPSPPTVIYLAADGWIAGAGTLPADIITRAGGVNAAAAVTPIMATSLMNDHGYARNVVGSLVEAGETLLGARDSAGKEVEDLVRLQLDELLSEVDLADEEDSDIVRDGVLVGYQLDRSSAMILPSGPARSNGCAYADSPGHIAIQRMANVSLQPGADARHGRCYNAVAEVS